MLRHTRALTCFVFLGSLAGLFLYSCSSANADFKSEVLADSPIVYYEFNELDPNLAAVDSSANSFAGTYVGGASLGASGPVGGVLSLDGETGYLDIPDLKTATKSWTAEWILRQDENIGGFEFVSIFSTDTFPTSTTDPNGINVTGNALHINSLPDPGNIEFVAVDNLEYIADPVVFDSEQFYHIVFSNDLTDPNNQSAQLYINGQTAEDFFSSQIEFIGATDPNQRIAFGPSALGAWDSGDPTGVLRFFNGDFDEFALYDKALSAADVNRHFLETGLAPVLTATVNRDTGLVTLDTFDPNNGSNVISQISLSSSSGSMDPNAYSGIAGTRDKNPPGDGSVDPSNSWVLNSLTATSIIDAQDPNSGPGGGADFSSVGPFSVGGIWLTSPFEDLVLTTTDPNGNVTLGRVTYTGGDPNNPLRVGDISSNGIDSLPDGLVDENDWNKFILGFSDPNSLLGLTPLDGYYLGDFTLDGAHTVDDYQSFVAAFDSANGAGAFVAMISGVPEPTTMMLSLVGGSWLLGRRKRSHLVTAHHRFRRKRSFQPWVLLIVALLVTTGSVSQAAELVKYEFTDVSCNIDTDHAYCDSSGAPVIDGVGQPGTGFFDPPVVSGGEVQFFGDTNEAIVVPMGSNYLFDGTQDWSFEVDFKTAGNTFNPELEQVLLSGFATADPNNVVYAPMHIRVGASGVFVFYRGEGTDPEQFGETEIELPGVNLYDGLSHSLTVTHVAPEDPNDPSSEGRLWINLDGNWVNQEFAATAVRQFSGGSTTADPNTTFGDLGPTSFTTMLGDTNDNAFATPGGEVSVIEFEGFMDNVVIRDNNVAPTTDLVAQVDLTTGGISLIGGEFNRKIKYLELASESGTLDPNAWSSLDDQDLGGVDPNDALANWTELLATTNRLVEAKVTSLTEFSDTVNSSVSLGAAFDSSSLVGDLAVSAVDFFGEVIGIGVEYVNLPGDFNGDLVVDGQDFLLWQRDPNVGSLSVWTSNYGTSFVIAAAGEEEEGEEIGVVPEPTSISLVGFALLNFITMRRHRKLIS